MARHKVGLTMVSLFFLAALLLTASCESVTGPGGPTTIDALPRALTVVVEDLVSASNGFAFRLLDEVRVDAGPRENVFLSPLSVSMALGMAANGARGTTLDSIRVALGTSHLTREEMNEGYLGLLDLLLPLDPSVELGIANSAWMKDDIPFLPPFIDRLERYFDADARPLDFGAPGAKDEVNAWVEDRTKGRIDEILEEILIEDILYLVNTVYFKGSWRSQFDPDLTENKPFRLEGGGSVEIPMMFQEDVEGLYYLQDGVKIADLPYGGAAFSMTVVVPETGTLSDLLASLTPERWDQWMAGLEPGADGVLLPRFELNPAAHLNEPLKRLGMRLAFDDKRADFWDVADPADVPETIFISRVKHKAFLKVDEEGTEATAATLTVIGIDCDCAFTVDRPFLVAIRERLSGTILFLGAVYDPS